MTTEPTTLFVSGYAEPHQPGIHAFRFEPSGGTFSPLAALDGIASPSFFGLHPNRRHLYAASEGMPGALYAIEYDARAQQFRVLNHQSSGGDGPCHVTIDSGGRWAIVSHYVSGSLSVFPIQPNGEVGAQSDSAQHSGSGPNQERQDAAHTHSTIFSPDERFLIAADLGADKLYLYRFNADKGRLTLHTQTTTRPGAGPRHCVFHPDGSHLYVANELDNSVALYQYANEGALTEMQVLSTLPPDAPATTTADIHITPGGDFLYVSNRGYDSIASYRVLADKTLELIAIQPCGGRVPRNFALTPDARYLLVANQESHNLALMETLAAAGIADTPAAQAAVQSPTCVRFA